MKGALHHSWADQIGCEFEKPYMQELQSFLSDERGQGKSIYPPEQLCFEALNRTAFESVKLVVLGQDPYHGKGQAHGLCFSVPKGIKTPPSLVNVYKELQTDIGLSIPDHGCLSRWADQGVLLLNTTLTVEDSQPSSHHNKGWEIFTDAIIDALNNQSKSLVFLLWGGAAHKKGAHIDRSRHCVLTAPHPSPLSAYRGFFGCRHFSQANRYLVDQGLQPINWQP